MQIISAGAGSGKTYTLTERIYNLVKSGAIRPECIVATTFTNKAAAELRERVKLKLLQEGMVAESEAIDGALIGTVHSIGTRILQRFAFELGCSPLVEIIPDDEAQTLFNLSLSRILTVDVTDQLQELCTQLAFAGGRDETHFDWRSRLKTLADLIQINALDAQAIQKSKERSWQRVQELLYQPSPEEAATLPAHPDAWLSRLAALLSETIETIEAKAEDTTKKTADCIETCRATLSTIKHTGQLNWDAWARISKLSFGKKAEPDAAALLAYASFVEANPLLQEHVRSYIYLMFDLAEQAVREFRQYKRKRGVIDYSDMELMLDEALLHPEVKAVLTQETDLLMVDEFQDTSPLQLSIFLKWSALAKQSFWVGDPKQSIYGFRGAEPALMKAVVEATGGIRLENILKDNYRSRPDLVFAANSIFVKGFADMPPEQVVLNPKRTDPSGFGKALISWQLRIEDNENKPPRGKAWTLKAIAQEVKKLLESGMLVLPKEEKTARPVQPADIAVLCRSNQDCSDVASALTEAGMTVSRSQAGLLNTTEGKFLLAMLRFLADRRDHLSIAEILVLSGQMPLETLINHRSEYQNTVPYDVQKPVWAREVPLIAQLDEMRKRIRNLSPVEILDLLLVETDISQYLTNRTNLLQRHANLEKMRAEAADYELACSRLHTAISLPGWLLWLDKKSRNGSDEQNSSESVEAVQVLTYHKSKGLEYPVVVCYSLEKRMNERFWGFSVVSEQDSIDLADVLANRHVEYRVHPFGLQIANTRLDQAVDSSPIYQQETLAARAEDARVLYVGLTRARDYLIIPSTVNSTPWLNRVFNGADDLPTLQPDSTESPFYYPPDAPLPVPVELHTCRYALDFEPECILEGTNAWLQPQSGAVALQDRTIVPEQEVCDDVRLRQISPQRSALLLPGTEAWSEPDWQVLISYFSSTAMHGNLAQQMQTLQKLLQIHHQAQAAPNEIHQAAEALALQLGMQSAQYQVFRSIHLSERHVSITIPLVAETQHGTEVVFFNLHKNDFTAVQNQLLWALKLLEPEGVTHGVVVDLVDGVLVRVVGG